MQGSYRPIYTRLPRVSSRTGLARIEKTGPKSSMSKLPQRIAALRLEKRMSQAELGQVLGVSRSAVSQWEKDQTVPQLAHLTNMADFFGISLASLMGADPVDKSIDAELRILPRDVADALKASFISTIEAVKKNRK